jgi:hypothetical protein
MASRALIIGPAHYREDPEFPGNEKKKLKDHDEIARSASLYGEILAADDRWWGPDQVDVLSEDQLNSIDDVMDALRRAAKDSKDGTLLVIYVGHGMYWSDVPGSKAYFAVGSSLPGEPSGWLSSWFVYRAMRQSKAVRKILIADCCHSGELGSLGPEDGRLYTALGEAFKGSCVLTAVKDVWGAEPTGCESLGEPFTDCTTFSGHLLSVLSHGTTDARDELTIGMVYDAVRDEMKAHGHDLPGMILNDAREQMLIFSNRRDASRRGSAASSPASPEGWAGFLLKKSDYELEPLLADPVLTGEVVALLYRHPDKDGRRIALRVNRRANEEYRGKPEVFASYWVKAAPAVADE